MIMSIFSFGEKIPEYEIKVLNEREVRASAGILFLFAMISFLNSWLIGDFTVTKTFVVVFLVEFSIRVLINPKYAPLLIISRLFVRNQEVEYVGAPQKRFAWLIGLVLATIMFYLVVLNNVIGPFNLLVCLICLTLLFFEAAFGICLGCKIYNLFHKQKAQLCPGNACAIKDREEIQKVNIVQFLLVPAFLALVYVIANSSLIHADTKNTAPSEAETKVEAEKNPQAHQAPVSEDKDCVVPEWAIKMGHREKWKLHNGCADNTKSPAPSETETKVEAEKMPQTHQAPAAENKDCVVPEWAIKMGHREKWKLHNGCK